MIAELLPTQSEQESFFDAFQSHLKKSISLNTHRASKFQENNKNFLLSATPFSKEFPDTMYVDREDTNIALGKTRQHLTGQFYIQEVAASLPANILKQYLPEISTLNSDKPITVLDLCAAPWGKTSQLADYLLAHNIPWIIWGNDVDAKRLSTRASNIQRCGLYNTVASKLDGSQIGNLYPEFFDAILVDAPCSGEGTGFKSDAAYKRWKEESINKIVWLQEHIVTSAIKACKPWGFVVYSTCTLNPFENELQIKKLLEKYGDALEILPINLQNKSTGIVIDNQSTGHEDKMLRCRPHIHHTGWFFVCVMRKKHSTLKPLQEHITNKKTKNNKQQKVQTPYQYNKQAENLIVKNLRECYGITLDLSQYAIIEWKHKLNLTDASVRNMVESGMRFHECGIPILKPTGKTFSLEHEIAIALWHLAQKNTIELRTEDLQKYCLWEDITLWDHKINQEDKNNIQIFNGYYILKHNGLGVWIGKIINGELKNKFFKW